uniref:Uncharacterized protein n=1 Tax=Brassica oleracea var. oleracea TaxID=109376 RepID=A0A0D2ZQV7_BRAOL
MLLLGGASQPIKRRVFVLPPLRWDCSDSANQEMYALPRCKVIHPLSMSNEPVSPIPEEYFRFRNHSEMLDYFDNEYISSIIAEGLCQGLNLALIVAELNEFIITAPSWAADGVNPEETPLPFYRIHGWQDNGDDMLGMHLVSEKRA